MVRISFTWPIAYSNLIFVQNIHFRVTIDIQGSQAKDALRKNEEKYKKSGMEHWK